MVEAIEGNGYKPNHDRATPVAADRSYAAQAQLGQSPAVTEDKYPAARVQLPPDKLCPNPGMPWTTFVGTVAQG